MSGQVDTRLYITAQPYAVVWGCIFSYASACLSARLIARYIARAYGSETGLYEYKWSRVLSCCCYQMVYFRTIPHSPMRARKSVQDSLQEQLAMRTMARGILSSIGNLQGIRVRLNGEAVSTMTVTLKMYMLTFQSQRSSAAPTNGPSRMLERARSNGPRSCSTTAE